MPVHFKLPTGLKLYVMAEPQGSAESGTYAVDSVETWRTTGRNALYGASVVMPAALAMSVMP